MLHAIQYERKYVILMHCRDGGKRGAELKVCKGGKLWREPENEVFALALYIQLQCL